MRDDDTDLRRSPPSTHVIGQDLSTLSLHELDARVALLEGEIVRLREAAAGKSASRTAADAFFKRS